MRELILKMSMSLDGFVSDVEGRNAWMFGSDQKAKDWSIALLWEAGLHVMGSRTFEVMAGYWPTATDDFAAPMNAIPKAVFSRRDPSFLRGAAANAEGWADARVLGGELAEEVARLKSEDGSPVVAHGGAAFAASLAAAGLVDRYVLLVHPIALGLGLPLFAGLAAPRRLELVEARPFPGGAVAQTYRPA